MAKKKSRKKKRSPRATAIDSVVGSGEKINGIDIYKVENTLETLTRANEFRKDEKLMRATEKLLKKRQDAQKIVAKQIRSR